MNFFLIFILGFVGSTLSSLLGTFKSTIHAPFPTPSKESNNFDSSKSVHRLNVKLNTKRTPQNKKKRSWRQTFFVLPLSSVPLLFSALLPIVSVPACQHIIFVLVDLSPSEKQNSYTVLKLRQAPSSFYTRRNIPRNVRASLCTGYST